MRPSFRITLAAVAGAILLTTAAAQKHPHFDDKGALAWQTKFSDAKAAAKVADKLIFVEYGRAACGNCRALAESVLTTAKVKERIGALAIGLAADCDEPESDLQTLLRTNLPDAKTLPFVAFLTPEGTWVDGGSGYQDVAEMLAMIERASTSPLMNAKPDVRKALEKPAAAATAAAAKADWKTVLAAAREAKKSTGRCAERTAIADAEKLARDWAASECDTIVRDAAAGGDLPALRKRLAAVKAPFTGEPEAADCDVGQKALQRLQTVREVEAGGNPAKDLRPRSAEPFKGTRWTALFVTNTDTPPARK